MQFSALILYIQLVHVFTFNCDCSLLAYDEENYFTIEKNIKT